MASERRTPVAAAARQRAGGAFSAVAATALLAGALLAPGATSAHPRSLGGSLVVVDDRGDDHLVAGADGCDADPSPSVRRCTLRAALTLVSRAGGGTVVLPAATIVRRFAEPYPVRGSVTLVGRGPRNSIVQGTFDHPVFTGGPSADLRLRGLAVVQVPIDPGGRSIVPPARLRLDDVVVADGGPDAVPGASAAAANCVIGGRIRTQLFRHGELSDPTAVAALPGQLF